MTAALRSRRICRRCISSSGATDAELDHRASRHPPAPAGLTRHAVTRRTRALRRCRADDHPLPASTSRGHARSSRDRSAIFHGRLGSFVRAPGKEMTDQEPRNGVICNIRHHIVKEAWLIIEHVGIFPLSSLNILAEFVAGDSMPEHLKEDVAPKIVNRKVDDNSGEFDVS
jgi:hypothetical protein